MSENKSLDQQAVDMAFELGYAKSELYSAIYRMVSFAAMVAHLYPEEFQKELSLHRKDGSGNEQQQINL